MKSLPGDIVRNLKLIYEIADYEEEAQLHVCVVNCKTIVIENLLNDHECICNLYK